MEETSLSPVVEPEEQSEVLSSEASEAISDESMKEYYALQRELLVTTLVLIGICFPAVWFFYDRDVALNYILGAFTGVMYLRLLGKNVEKLGQGGSVGKSQVGVFAVVMIAATQIDQLSPLPIFLGFLTFKAAIFVYTLRYVSTST
jgi:ATP synthase protein I